MQPKPRRRLLIFPALFEATRNRIARVRRICCRCSFSLVREGADCLIENMQADKRAIPVLSLAKMTTDFEINSLRRGL
jgi:hypothetical protein